MNKVQIHIKRTENLILPTKANPSDTGYDIFAHTDPIIVGNEVRDGIYSSIKYIEYGTGLYVSPQEKVDLFQGGPFGTSSTFWLQGLPRSSISKYNLVVANSCPTLDNGYRGQIMIRFKYITQSEDFVLDRKYFDGEADWSIIGARVNVNKIYKKRDAILQIRPVQNTDVEWLLVDDLDNSDRGAGGFGSSGNNSTT